MSVTEQELAKLSYPDAPKMITPIPGPKARKIVEESLNTESMARGGGAAPFVFADGKGATIKDADGNLLVDITAGVAVNAVGRCHPKVVQAIKDQAGILMQTSDISSVMRTNLAERISDVAAGDLKGNCITYFTQTGSGAAETALKFMRRITGRSQVIAYHGAYHGVWGLCGSLTTGNQYRRGFLQPQPTIHVPYPYCYRCAFGKEYPSCDMQCAKYVDMILNEPYTGAHDVAALIIEPQQGEGGYIVPPPEYLPMIKKACEKNGCLFIADEVQSGAGRSGKMWSIEYSGITPDMHTYGKGLGGDMPSAGLVMRREFGKFIEPGSQPNTFAGNGVVAAATIANIDILAGDDYALVKRCAAVGEEIMGEFREFQKTSKTLGEVRGRGLMIGLEMVEDKKTRAPLAKEKMMNMVGEMMQKGFLINPCGRFGNVFRLMPPLVITREQANATVKAFIETIKEMEKKQ